MHLAHGRPDRLYSVRLHGSTSGSDGLPLEEAAIMFLPGSLNLDSLSIIRLAALLLSFVNCACLLEILRRSLATLPAEAPR